MNYPKIYHDNKAVYGTLTASSETSPDKLAANIKDFRSYTYWKPTVLPAVLAMDVADPTHKWEFTNSDDSWVGNGMTLTPQATHLQLDTTVINSHFNRVPSAPVRGDVYRYVMIRFRWATQSSAWNGLLQWATRAHGAIDQLSYYHQMANPIEPGYVTQVFDMWSPTVGGRDWRDSLITQINVDFVDGTGDQIDVDWACLSRDPFCDHLLLLGHNCATQGNSVKVEGSNESSSTGLITLVSEFYPPNDKPAIKAITSDQSTRWKRITFANGSVPDVAIVVVGRTLEIPSYLDNGFDPTLGELHGETNVSEEGNPLGNVFLYNGWEQQLHFPLVSWDWIRDNWVPAWEANLRSRPSVFQWAPAGYPAELFYLNPITRYKTPHQSGLFADLDFRAQGLKA